MVQYWRICMCCELDVSTNRKMLKAVLNRNGAKNVSTAENGLEAVSEVLANPQKYSIVFMDNLMPVMVRPLSCSSSSSSWTYTCSPSCTYQNGVEATRKLREGGYGNLVIGVTGNILEDDVWEYLSAGADMIMGKPVKVVLLKLLLQYVRESGALSRPEMYLMEDEHAHSLDWRRRKDVWGFRLLGIYSTYIQNCSKIRWWRTSLLTCEECTLARGDATASCSRLLIYLEWVPMATEQIVKTIKQLCMTRRD